MQGKLDTLTFDIEGKFPHKKLKFLIDTGAVTSIIKKEYIDESEIFPMKNRRIVGITTESITPMGKTCVLLKTSRYKTAHQFIVVDEKVQIRYAGILGRDFWQTKDANIDFKNRCVHLRNIVIPFDEMPEAENEIKLFRITLEARSETIVNLPTKQTHMGIIPKQCIVEGVYLAETLVMPENGQCKGCIININDKHSEIVLPMVQLQPVDDEVLETHEQNMTNVEDENMTINVLFEQNQEQHMESMLINQERQNRLKLLYENLRLDHLNDNERKSIIEICNNYNDIFYLPGDTLTATDAVEHSIPTPSLNKHNVINLKPYRLPDALKEEVKKQTTKLLYDGIIVPSKSAWNFPLLVIPKKGDASGQKKYRIVIDFRRLNDVTVGDSFPLPNINEILDQLGKAQYFTTLDLASGFWQIPLKKEDQEKTAFSTGYEHYMFTRMPQGLKNSPSTFQRLMNNVLSGIQGIKCFVYLDDIVIYGNSLQSHNEKMLEIFERLRIHKLQLHPDKCEFLHKEVIYLGHKISENGVKPDPGKVEKVKEFPKPKNVKDIKSFTGLCNYYRRFIPNFSKIMEPLTSLLRKNVTFKWESTQEESFEKMKELLTSEPLLQYPDFEKPFILTTDASNDAIGSVLSQGEIGQDLPIAYASRTLNSAERNYPTVEKELLSIVWSVKQFRPYVYGRKFTIVTDHKPLTWIFNVKDPSSRLMRWRLKLEEYEYTVVYKKGKHNTNADALSRIHMNEVEENEQKHRQEILKEFHQCPLGGHEGMNRTYQRIKMYHDWEGMKKDIEDYIRQCESCQKNKITQHKTRLPLVLTTTPDSVFEKVCLDIVGPLPVTTHTNKYILTFQDELSKYTVAIPIEQQDANTVAQAFVEHIILKFGIPQIVLTDQGSNFMSDIFKHTCKLLRIKKINTTAYHPETNGALERSHRTLTEYLRHFISEDQRDWDLWIPYATFVFNTTPHSATGFTPHELMFGRKPNIPGILQKTPNPLYNHDEYAHELKSRLQSSYEKAKEQLIKNKEKHKEHYDQKVNFKLFQPGDKVLLFDETLRRGRSQKLQTQWRGPYEVIKVNEPNVTIKIKNKDYKVHANRLKHFF